MTDAVKVPKDRLEQFQSRKFKLHRGGHTAAEQADGQLCATETIDWLGGRASPVVRRFLQILNDRWDDKRRQKLQPYILRALTTKDDGRDQERAQLCREWLVRKALPSAMDLAGCEDVATRLRELPDPLTVENTSRLLSEARTEAGKARDKAYRELRERFGLSADAAAAAAAAAYAAADAAAYAAAYAAAAYAAYAAYAAAAAAAYAYAAAYAAYAYAAAAAADAAAKKPSLAEVRERARKAAEKKLKPLADQFEAEALELLDRMLPEKVEVVAA